MERTIQLELISRDVATQSRAQIVTSYVDELAEAYKEGGELPPVDVFEDGAGGYWLADGWHRVLALESLQRVSTRATVHEGGRREAIFFAVTANQRHGLRRTAEDKRRAVSTLLDDPDWWKLGEMEISRLCGVSRELVQELLEPKRGKEPPSVKRKRRKEGKSATAKEQASPKKATPEGGEMSEKTSHPPEVVKPPSVDAKGTELGSDWLREVFAAVGEFDVLRKAISDLKPRINALLPQKGGKKLLRTHERLVAALDDARRFLRYAKPYVVCVYCHDQPPAKFNCQGCAGDGWMTEDQYKQSPQGKAEKAAKP